jgi:hypothetical protein
MPSIVLPCVAFGDTTKGRELIATRFFLGPFEVAIRRTNLRVIDLQMSSSALLRLSCS